MFPKPPVDHPNHVLGGPLAHAPPTLGAGGKVSRRGPPPGHAGCPIETAIGANRRVRQTARPVFHQENSGSASAFPGKYRLRVRLKREAIRIPVIGLPTVCPPGFFPTMPNPAAPVPVTSASGNRPGSASGWGRPSPSRRSTTSGTGSARTWSMWLGRSWSASPSCSGRRSGGSRAARMRAPHRRLRSSGGVRRGPGACGSRVRARTRCSPARTRPTAPRAWRRPARQLARPELR